MIALFTELLSLLNKRDIKILSLLFRISTISLSYFPSNYLYAITSYYLTKSILRLARTDKNWSCCWSSISISCFLQTSNKRICSNNEVCFCLYLRNRFISLFQFEIIYFYKNTLISKVVYVVECFWTFIGRNTEYHQNILSCGICPRILFVMTIGFSPNFQLFVNLFCIRSYNQVLSDKLHCRFNFEYGTSRLVGNPRWSLWNWGKMTYKQTNSRGVNHKEKVLNYWFS